MNTLPSPATLVPNSSYEITRFNALRHGVLSRHTVLPWEDRSEYQTLLDALAAEHAPDGPTEKHLVEELAGIIWRKRRLRIAEASVYREKLRHDANGYGTPEHLAGAALLPLTGSADHKANIGTAETAVPALTRDEIEAKMIDLAAACSRVPLRFVMVAFAWPDAGAEDVPQGCARAAHRGRPW